MFNLSRLESRHFVAVAVLLGIYVAVRWLFDKSPSAPGPRFAKFSDIWYFRKVWQGHFEEDNIELHEKNGKIVRVGPNQYSIDDPDAVKLIYGHGTQFTKSSWYRGWTPPEFAHVNLFTIQNPNLHGAERRKFASMYSMSTLVSYEPYVDDCVKIMCQRLDELARAQKVFSVPKWMQYFAFDVIGEITFAKRFGFIEAGDDIRGIIRGLEVLSAQSTFCGIYIWLAPFVFTLFSGGLTYTMKFINDNIAERMKSMDSPEKLSRPAPDVLSKVVAFHKNDPETYTTLHLFTACAQNVIAGSDTTAITLNAIFYYISRDARVLAKLQNEIDDATAQGVLSEPVTFAQAQKLPYLQLVVKEAMRMHPATGLPLWRDVPAGGATIAGQFFPAKTSVGINAWVAHRNAAVFGPDPNVFRPERWVDSPPSQLAAMERYYMPFGLGSRTCIGKHISILEINKLVPELVRRYEFHLQGTDWSWKNRWFVKQSDFDVVASERKGARSIRQD